MSKYLDLDGLQRFKQKLDDRIPFVAEYGVTTYSELSSAIADDKAIIVNGIAHNGSEVTAIANNATDDGSTITLESIATDQGDLWDVTLTVTNGNAWTAGWVSRDPFMLLDFSQQINVTIPSVTQDIANTSIPNVDVSITDAMGADWAIASLAKYEVYDATSGGNRLNVMPICMFSMNTQKTLRLRMMAAGSNSKAAKRIQGAILLKHR